MISLERYIELRGFLDGGANLPPINLEEMGAFEEKHNLLEKQNGYVYRSVPKIMTIIAGVHCKCIYFEALLFKLYHYLTLSQSFRLF